MGVSPKLVLDLLSLMGDSADNIPGVPGVGPKTAVKIIQKAGSVEGLLENVKVKRAGYSYRHYHDVFLLESYASHKEHGVKVYDEPLDDKHINQKDFWVLNTNNYPVTIRSNTGNFENMEIPAHGLKLIKVKNPFCYKFGDVFCEYNDKRVSVTAIERG